MEGEAVTAGMRRHPQFSPLASLRWQTIYRDGGLACANYPAYPAVTGREYNSLMASGNSHYR